MSDADVVSRATNIQTQMTGNANFPNPPADLAALKTTFSSLIAESLDLGRGCNQSNENYSDRNEKRRMFTRPPSSRRL